MLGLDNPLHIAFLLVLVLIVFGAKRLPEMGKSLGSGLRGFKDSLSGEDITHDDDPTATHRDLTATHSETTATHRETAPALTEAQPAVAPVDERTAETVGAGR